MSTEKKCSACDQTKPLSKFCKAVKSKDGLHALCRACASEYAHKWYIENPEKVKKARSRYRFRNALQSSICNAKKGDHVPCTATVREITEAFTGFCQNPGCRVPEVECERRLNLDHDHITGEFRGWLCRNCNSAAGLLRDSVNTVFGLAEYLDSFSVFSTRFER